MSEVTTRCIKTFDRATRTVPLPRRALLRGAVAPALAMLLPPCVRSSRGPSARSELASSAATPGAEAGRQTETATSTTAPLQRKPAILRWGTGTLSLLQSPMLVAIRAGFFAEEGIEIDTEHLNRDVTEVQIAQLDADASVIKLLTAGAFDFVDVSFAGELSAIAVGATIAVLGAVAGPAPLLFVARRQIQDLQALEGRSAAVSAPRGLSDVVVRFLLSQAGVDLRKVQLINLGGALVRAGALSAGRVHASVFAFDYAAQVDSIPDAYRMFAVPERLPAYITGGLAVRRETFRGRHDVLVRAARAYLRGVRHVNEPGNRENVLDLMGRLLEKPAEELSMAFDLYVRHQVFVDGLGLTPEQFEFTQNVNLTAGAQRIALPFDRVVEPSVRDAAIASLPV